MLFNKIQPSSASLLGCRPSYPMAQLAPLWWGHAPLFSTFPSCTPSTKPSQLLFNSLPSPHPCLPPQLSLCILVKLWTFHHPHLTSLNKTCRFLTFFKPTSSPSSLPQTVACLFLSVAQTFPAGVSTVEVPHLQGILPLQPNMSINHVWSACSDWRHCWLIRACWDLYYLNPDHFCSHISSFSMLQPTPKPWHFQNMTWSL